MKNNERKTPSGIPQSSKMLKNHYNLARSTLVYFVACGAVNLLALALSLDLPYFFSVFLATAIVAYTGISSGAISELKYFNITAAASEIDAYVPVLAVIVAISLLAIYLILFFASAEGRSVWLKVAVALYTVDTVVLAIALASGFINIEGLLDLAYHVAGISFLIYGIRTQSTLERIPEGARKAEAEIERGLGEGTLSPANLTPAESFVYLGIDASVDTEPLYPAALVKHRVLCEASVLGRQICYRRVKRTNELVIDGMVYDRYEALIEFAHALRAVIDGVVFEAGFDGNGKSYIAVNGNLVAEKIRLI